jgi:hypothetical protein
MELANEQGCMTTTNGVKSQSKELGVPMVKVLFQELHMTHINFVLVYNLKFCILNTPFSITF